MGKVKLYTYDNQKRVLSTTEQASNGSSSITTSASYDKNGNKCFVTDGNGNVTENTYDELNRLESTTVIVNSVNEETVYSYDANGNKVLVTDWRGNVTQYVYDPLNRLINKIDANDKTIETLQYYDNGTQSNSYDALNYVTQYFYDKNKRLIKTIDPENHITQQSYDAVGNIDTKTDGDNNVTQYFYDQYNNLLTVTNSNIESTIFTYDLNGNMLSQTYGLVSTSLFEYNATNKLTRIIDNGGRIGSQGSYSYNGAKTQSFTYYADGSMESKTDRNGLVTSYTYDVHGRMLSESVGKITISFTYDNNGNLLTVGKTTTTYAYDENGYLITFGDTMGITIRNYDELNRVTSKYEPGIGTSTYVYDIITGMNAGTHEESTTDPKGNITLKIYDKVGRLSKVITDGTTTTYSYSDNGSLESVIYPDGSGEYYTYYSDNLINTLVNKKANGDVTNSYTIINSYSYTYDAAHNMLKKKDGEVETAYTYDKLNRLETVTAPDTTVTTYSYDAAGNRSTIAAVNGTVTTITNYSYDDQNRLTSTTTTANGIVTETVAYIYDNNGNELNSFTTPHVNGDLGDTQTTINTYDELNELIQTTTPNVTSIVNIYDGEGIRVAKATNGDIIRYLYEGDKVILETDVDGAQIARNIYGTKLISRTENGVTGYYFYNGHADVTSIVGGGGATLATYYYDEFGNLVSSTGSFDNPYRYAGYQYDSETDTYYLMARMYDPSTGRFLQEDSYRGDIKDPLSLNYYAYCSGNPLIYSDPNGHRRIDEASLQEETDEERHDSLVDEKKAMASEGGKSAASKELYGPPAPSKASISTKAVTNFSLQSIINSLKGKGRIQKGFSGAGINKGISNDSFKNSWYNPIFSVSEGYVAYSTNAFVGIADGVDMLNSGVQFTRSVDGKYIHVKGSSYTLNNLEISGRRYSVNNADAHPEVFKYIDGETAVSEALTSKANIALSAVGIGIDTYNDVSKIKGTYEKVVVGTTDVVIGAGGAAVSTAAGAYFGAAIGTAICPGVGTIAGAVIGIGVGLAYDYFMTPVKKEIEYQLAPSLKNQNY